jgi:ABC-type antimicrobial peptide transport system permease subunit
VVGIAPGRRSEVFDERPSPHVYVPFGWEYRSNMNIHLRLVAGGPEAATTVLGTIREEVQQFDERLPVLVLKTLEDFRADNPNVRILQALAGVVNAFGALALFLAVVGLYGVKASAVSRRTRELGIRMALGGRRVDVLWLVLREGLVVTLVGLGLGAVLSLGTARLLGTLLYGVGAFDPLVFLVASLSLAGSALLASYLPARKATRVDPVAALRTE